MMKWISTKYRLPQLNLEESHDPNHSYQSNPVLIYCNEYRKEMPGIQYVGYLCKKQEDCNLEDMHWECYIHDDGGETIKEIKFCDVTHWMPLPKAPGDKMEWIKCSDQLPPKEGKFLFSYHYGTGLGEWGQCYTEINGNSESSHKAYILTLWTSEILSGIYIFTLDDDKMIEMEFKWMEFHK